MPSRADALARRARRRSAARARARRRRRAPAARGSLSPKEWKSGSGTSTRSRARELEEELRVEAVVERLAVREQRALRRAGRARRVHEDHRVVGRRPAAIVGVRRGAASAAS